MIEFGEKLKTAREEKGMTEYSGAFSITSPAIGNLYSE